MIREIVEAQLEQLRLIGLLLATTGRFEKEVKRVQSIWNVSKGCLIVAENDLSDLSLEGVPVVYNPSNWHSDRLCGYIGSDLQISPGELITSRLELWLLALRYPEHCKNHFSKCALWFAETHGRNPAAGLSFLLDLYESGFFVNVSVFFETLVAFIRFYSIDVNLSFMNGATVANVSLINEHLSSVARSFQGVKSNSERYNELLGVVIDLTLDRVEDAYDAHSLDDWIVRQASILGPVEWLAMIYPSAEELGVSIQNHMLLSRFNEMASDILPQISSRQFCADFELAPTWDLSGLETLAVQYRELYSDDLWLDRMTEDRLVIPNDVRELVRGLGRDAFKQLRLPPHWRLPSEKLILPLCIAHGREPALLRSVDFGRDSIDAEIHAMALPAEEYDSQVAARRQLLKRESTIVVNEAFQSRGLNTTRLAEIRALYPWNPDLWRLVGTSSSLMGDFEGSFAPMCNSVLINSHDPMSWLALATLAEIKGRRNDYVAFRTIADAVTLDNATST